jgi:chromosome segregation protein
MIAKLGRQLGELNAQTREIAGRAPDAEKLAQITEAGQQLADQIERFEGPGDRRRGYRARHLRRRQSAREESAKAHLSLASLRAERETLVKLLIGARQSDFPPIVDRLRVAPGYEAALGAALGDDLEAPAAEDAPVHWRRVEVPRHDGALPSGVELLADRVEAPPELDRRLRQTGVVASREQGQRLQPQLKPGQRLVTREGDLWRWDGFTAAADGATPAAQRCRTQLACPRSSSRKRSAHAARDGRNRARDRRGTANAQAEEQRLRKLWREGAGHAGQDARKPHRVERAARDTESKLAAVSARALAPSRISSSPGIACRAEAALAEFAAAADIEPALAASKSQAELARTGLAEARSELNGLERERRTRAERIAAIGVERERWGTRSAGAEQQIEALKERLAEAQGELEGLADVPAMIEARRGKLLSALSDAERQRQVAADALAAADATLKGSVQALRAAQNSVTEQREGRARTEARLEGARTRRQDVARHIREALGIAPEGCLAVAEVAPGTALPPLADVEHKLSGLKVDRERLGGVNLGADDELQMLSTQVGSLDAERADVESAIAKLRSAIGQLNREAHKRLQDAFEAVDNHFRKLFTTLFGGGEARLEMIEGEDPLEGGLEIVAKPPGRSRRRCRCYRAASSRSPPCR